MHLLCWHIVIDGRIHSMKRIHLLCWRVVIDGRIPSREVERHLRIEARLDLSPAVRRHLLQAASGRSICLRRELFLLPLRNLLVLALSLHLFTLRLLMGMVLWLPLHLAAWTHVVQLFCSESTALKRLARRRTWFCLCVDQWKRQCQKAVRDRFTPRGWFRVTKKSGMLLAASQSCARMCPPRCDIM